MKTIAVAAARPYEIIIGAGLLEKAGSLARQNLGGERAAIVSDAHVAPLYAGQLGDALGAAGYAVCQYMLPAGENAKSAENFIALLEFFAGNKLSRSDLVLALGGGVVGDVAGFAAASYMRGLRLMQLPTTLLAAVDSSVGGKTAINLKAGKNLAGAFYQPHLVLSDYSMLDTLPEQYLIDGCAEVVKYAMIAEPQLLDLLAVLLKPYYEEIIARCVAIKSRLVAADEFDTGSRQLLNFGHTFGHAIETCSGFTVPHGRAVAMGMVIASRAAAARGLCGADCPARLMQTLLGLGLPINCDYGADELYQAMLLDKKRDGDTFTIVLPERIGFCRLEKVNGRQLQEYLRLGLEQNGGQ
ncbi:MAG: 3-dehydroquinate synthase [Clostridia bacterium]|nr:3-dehydroquinate synthase [Clostridia bacterium]